MLQAYLSPSSRGTTVCIQQLVLISLFRRLSLVLVGSEQSNQDKRQLPSTCFGSRYARNILRISCASIWFSFTVYIDMHVQQNITFNGLSSWYLQHSRYWFEPVSFRIPASHYVWYVGLECVIEVESLLNLLNAVFTSY